MSKHIKELLLIAALVILAFNSHAEDAPESINKLTPILEQWGINPILVGAVKSHNAENISLSEIQKKDKIWQETDGVNDFMKGIMSNPAAVELKRLEASLPYLFECFLMGDKGANVAMTNKTSDYWQGDEAKFIESFKEGKGEVFIGQVKFDNSAQAYLVQISVPVKDENTTIGVITIGVNLDEYEASL